MWLKCLWCFAGFQALFCTEETIRSRGEREKAAQLFRKSNKSSVSSLDGDFCSCLEGYWTDLCVCVCVCFRMYRPSQHSVCGAWHSSQGCVWSSLLFSDHYHCACFIGERVLGHLTPPPTSWGLSPRQPWTADCVCRPSLRRSWILQVCVCVMHLQVFICTMVHGNNSCFLFASALISGLSWGRRLFGRMRRSCCRCLMLNKDRKSSISVSQRKGYVCISVKTDMCR